MHTDRRVVNLLGMNYETDISVENVCKLFCQKYPRRMEKANLLFQVEMVCCYMGVVCKNRCGLIPDGEP